MHSTVKNLINIQTEIKSSFNSTPIKNFPKIIAVSKTFPIEKIIPLIEYGHCDYGENKVQEAINKWLQIKEQKLNIKIHLIGKLQSNKVKDAVKLFDYIHSVDSKKLAKKISDEQNKLNKNIKIFIQVNIGDEAQKSGVSKEGLNELIYYCRELNLQVLGLMCIPPFDKDSNKYFKEMNKLNKKYNFTELSMGMSADFLSAISHDASYVRIGSNIFGSRS